MKKFDIPTKYQSSVITEIKAIRLKEDRLKKDFSPTVINRGKVNFVLARHFGFCFGVENAVEKIYRILEEHPNKNIYLLSQMIHNPIVNDDLQDRGVKFIMDTFGNQLIDWDIIKKNDIVIVPAFGTTIEIEKILKTKGIALEAYDTTCPFVEKVWKRSGKLSESEHTIIIHGKEKHEETRATFSHASEKGRAIVLRDITEAKILGNFILGNKPASQFNEFFGNKSSQNFNVLNDLTKVGVVNQTTMLATETKEIADYFKTVMITKYGEENISNHFADTRDTLCYATNDNQNSTLELLKQNADLAIVVGGYNSSNTTHLVELLEQKFNTFFISSEAKIHSKENIISFNYKTKQEEELSFLIGNKANWNIIVTCGASCPDSILAEVIDKIDHLIN
jgi:4-hydroxy-3-methylbut-2-enyl diphosphate reductase